MTATPTPADQRSATRVVFPEPRRVELEEVNVDLIVPLAFSPVIQVLTWRFNYDPNVGVLNERADAARRAPPRSGRSILSGWRRPAASPRSSGYDIAPEVLFTEAYDGHLLGSETLGQEVTYLEVFQQGAAYLVQNDGWTGQPWASSLPSSP